MAGRKVRRRVSLQRRVSATMPSGRGSETARITDLPSRRTGTPKTSGRVTVYFAALLARTEDGWEASDTELDDVESLSPI